MEPDLVIGCDGAYSAVRKEMMRKPRFNYSQVFSSILFDELGEILHPDLFGGRGGGIGTLPQQPTTPHVFGVF